MKTDRILPPSEEASSLLGVHSGPEGMASALNVLTQQFLVIQTRSQLLLSLATLVLTITGFSGPKIAATNLTARLLLVAGISIVLLATAVTLIQSLKVRWITQIKGDSDKGTLEMIILKRNRKPRSYAVSLVLLVIGLACYVGSVVVFLLVYKEPL
jgi:hypothetical protein